MDTTTDAKPDPASPANTAVKPGWQSTEAWITLVVTIIGAVLASGLLNPGDPTQAQILKIGGMVMSLAAALGYQQSRTALKTAAINGAVTIATSPRAVDPVSGRAE